MSLFNRIFRSIRDDYDFYLIFIPVITLAFASPFVDVIAPYINEATLIVLGLVSLVLLRTRNIFRKGSHPVPSDAEFGWTDSIDEIKHRIKDYDEMWFWGGTLTEHVSVLEEPLRREARNGKKIRMLLVKEGGNAIRDLAIRHVIPPQVPYDPDQNASYRRSIEEKAAKNDTDLRSNLLRLANVKQAAPENTEIRTIDYLAPYVIYVFNPNASDGVMTVRLGYHSGSNEYRPTYKFSRRSDPEKFEHYLHQFRSIWAAAGALEYPLETRSAVQLCVDMPTGCPSLGWPDSPSRGLSVSMRLNRSRSHASSLSPEPRSCRVASAAKHLAWREPISLEELVARLSSGFRVIPDHGFKSHILRQKAPLTCMNAGSPGLLAFLGIESWCKSSIMSAFGPLNCGNSQYPAVRVQLRSAPSDCRQPVFCLSSA